MRIIYTLCEHFEPFSKAVCGAMRVIQILSLNLIFLQIFQGAGADLAALAPWHTILILAAIPIE
ncbi:uncharacterized protein Dvar_04190 [Desulfosarcina variabilis str. Montpellier]